MTVVFVLLHITFYLPKDKEATCVFEMFNIFIMFYKIIAILFYCVLLSVLHMAYLFLLSSSIKELKYNRCENESAWKMLLLFTGLSFLCEKSHAKKNFIQLLPDFPCIKLLAISWNVVGNAINSWILSI